MVVFLEIDSQYGEPTDSLGHERMRFFCSKVGCNMYSLVSDGQLYSGSYT